MVWKAWARALESSGGGGSGKRFWEIPPQLFFNSVIPYFEAKNVKMGKEKKRISLTGSGGEMLYLLLTF